MRIITYIHPVAVILENVWACWQDERVIEVVTRVCALQRWNKHLFRMTLQHDRLGTPARGGDLSAPCAGRASLPPHLKFPRKFMPISAAIPIACRKDWTVLDVK